MCRFESCDKAKEVDFTSRILDSLAASGGLIEAWKGIGCRPCDKARLLLH